jgi:hypothetical protein
VLKTAPLRPSRFVVHRIDQPRAHSGKSRQQLQFSARLPIGIRFRIYTLVMPPDRISVFWSGRLPATRITNRSNTFQDRRNMDALARLRICKGSFNSFFDLV